ncbi:twin-arginine translocase subunit TatC [Halopiger goleimassiliensis]|uniref:twin-arginine translocase subunit TatC n=1 Tax=Halopiger goleimassiliensis TaxID=1293048 RepID=UPI000677F256|nr:twin-arginine translocase subunit TatC [Halopiger goleimassiliensis]
MSDESAPDEGPSDPEEAGEPEESTVSAADSSDADGDAEPADEGTDGAEADEPADDGTDADEAAEADEPEIDRPPALRDQPVETDGEGVVGGGHGSEETSPEYPDPDEDVGGISTPPDDEEMPLADHIEEMILRLAVVLLFGAAGTAIGLLWAMEAIDFIWHDVVPYMEVEGRIPPPHVYHPLEPWLTRIKVAALLGIMVALPTFVYECYKFMKPGLYPHERKYYLAAVPTSVVLAGIGMLFSYFLVLPALFYYFTYYADGSAGIAYALGDTFDLVITLTAFLAIVFQIPLFIMLAIMMGVTTRRWLAAKRLYFWAAFLGLSFMFTMDPTMMAPILVAITMILLFEGTLAILKWVGRE